jgi:hypothetical protein
MSGMGKGVWGIVLSSVSFACVRVQLLEKEINQNGFKILIAAIWASLTSL